MNFFVLYKNTLLMIFFRVLCAVLTATMAGYAFGRLHFKGRDFCFSLVLLQMMVPGQIFITPQYLSRLFSRYLGCSVYEYLTKFRLSKAKELLVSNRGRRIQDIAQDVGYTDASHFVVMFRKITGIAPSEFRRIN